MVCTPSVQYVPIVGCIDDEEVVKILVYSSKTPGKLIDTIYSDGSDGTGWTPGVCPAA